jgi:DNA-binding transcriptional LysR family regulator
MVANGFEEFVAIVELGSITKAADAVGVPRPTVSKRLGRLEERLGVRLLHRTTRRIKPTQQGRLLYEKARPIVQAAREAEAAVQRLDNVPRGLLRLLIPPRVHEEIFTVWLADFMLAFPEVSLDVVGTDVHVDLVAEGFDVALRYGAIENTSLISRTLATNTELAVASPQYLEARGTPTSAEELGEHECIIGYKGSNVPRRHWPLLDGGSIEVRGRFMVNHLGLQLQAARRHVGIALVIERVAADLLASGEIVKVLPNIVGRLDHARLVYPDREFLDPKVRAFVDFIAARVAESRREAS